MGKLLCSCSALGSAVVLKSRGGQRYFSKMFAIPYLKNTSAVSLKLKIWFHRYVDYHILNCVVTCHIYQYKLQ